MFAGASLFRLGAVWSFPVDPLQSDFQEYWVLARAIAERGSFDFGPDWRDDPILRESSWNFLFEEKASIFRPPGYPAVLAALQVTVGTDLRRHQVALALADGLTALVLFLIATRLFGVPAGLGAVTLFVLSPGMTYQITRMGREPFLALFVALGLLCTLNVLRRGGAATGAAAGLAFGIGGYFKETILATGGASALFLLWLAWRRGRKELVRPAIALLLVLLSCPLPWLARNAIQHERFVGFSNMSGLATWAGLVPRNWIRAQPEPVQRALDHRLASDAVEANRRLWGQVRAFALQDPVAVATAMALNAALFWSPVPRLTWQAIFPSLDLGGAGPFRATEAVSLAYYLTLFGLAARGLWVHRRSDASALVVWLLLFLTGVHALTVSWPRYRLPFDVLLLPFAGVALASLIQHRMGGRARTS